jgi:hypothetical protein
MMPSEKVWYWPRKNMILISWASDMYWECEDDDYPYCPLSYENEFILLGEV